MNFNQLIIADDGSISVAERDFKELHEKIVYYGTAAAEFAVKMASNLKEMRDSKLYKQAGFEEFGEYAEKALGIKERQAYNYIRVFEELPQEYLQSNAKLGITKLTLLAGVDNSERQEIAQSVDLESVSVRELKETISQMSERAKQLEMSLSVSEQKYTTGLQEATRQKEEAYKLQTVYEQRAKELEKQISELKATPVEVVADPLMEKQLADKEEELEKLAKEAEDLKKRLLVSDGKMSVFKVRFEELQRVIADVLAALNELNEEQQDKCRSALNAVLEGLKSE